MEAADICPNAKRFLGADSPPPELLSSELKKQEKKSKNGVDISYKICYYNTRLEKQETKSDRKT